MQLCQTRRTTIWPSVPQLNAAALWIKPQHTSVAEPRARRTSGANGHRSFTAHVCSRVNRQTVQRSRDLGTTMHQQAQHGSTVAFARASARSDRQLKIHAGRDASARALWRHATRRAPQASLWTDWTPASCFKWQAGHCRTEIAVGGCRGIPKPGLPSTYVQSRREAAA